MREIKFRAWDKKMKKMRMVESIGFGKPYYFHEGYPVVNMVGRDCINNKDIIIHRDSHQCELMQYTGLKDKNNKGIYEGDILRCKCKIRGYEYFKKDEKIFEYKNNVIEWWQSSCNLGYRLRNARGNTMMIKPSCLKAMEVEVIGNIYENPELLEVEE